MRRFIGRLIEWFLNYEHLVAVRGVGPSVGYSGDAGYDLFVTENITVEPGTVAEVPSSLRIDPRSSIWFEIKARSSTFRRLGLEVQDAVIDRGYRGQLFAIVYNPTNSCVVIPKLTRVCQIVPHRLINCKFVPGDLKDSDRGHRGFGSSGE